MTAHSRLARAAFEAGNPAISLQSPRSDNTETGGFASPPRDGFALWWDQYTHVQTNTQYVDLL